MSCRIPTVEHRKCAAGLAVAHPGLQDRMLLNFTRTEKAHKLCKKTFDFLVGIAVKQTFNLILIYLFMSRHEVHSMNTHCRTQVDKNRQNRT